jgi:hypothetical protein
VIVINLYLKDEVMNEVPKHPMTLIEHSQATKRKSKHHTS